LLTAQAWDAVRAYPVLAARESEQTAALRASGVAVSVDAAPTADALLAAASAHGTVVWLAGPTGDPDLARELGLRLAREPGLAELELMYGSWDPPGARLLDAVAVMDRLVSPGGDPWKRSQTHASLAQFLLEEAYEAYDAIAAGDLAALREELGDVLLQVVLHARLAAEAGHWDVDDVAGDLVDKLVRRNPHVFSDTTVDSVDEIVENWEQIKRVEKARESAMDGIALSQPALALAAKVLSRAARAGVAVPLPADGLGPQLLAIVAQARERGEDAEGALRATALAYADAVRAAERERRSPAVGGADAERRSHAVGGADAEQR
jgi:XTP/dITP diphosphohydrolase